MPLLHTLLYRSHATRALDERELLPILMTSMRNNARVGLTGLLLYGPLEPLPESDDPPPTNVIPFDGPGVFVQWLEGPEDAIRTTFDRIDHDRRHTDVEILARGTREARLFPHWSMALETVRTLPETALEVERFAADRHNHKP